MTPTAVPAAPEAAVEAQGGGRGGRACGVPACSPGSRGARTPCLQTRPPQRGFSSAAQEAGSRSASCPVQREGLGHCLQTPGWEGRSEAETQPHWASPRPGGRPCLTQGATQPFPWTARLCMCEMGGVGGAAGGHRPCPSPATVDGWGTWATLLLPSWAPPMSHCVRKLDKLENVKLIRGGRKLGKVSAGSSSSEHGSCSFPEPGAERAWTPRALRNHREAPQCVGVPSTHLRSPGSHPADPAFSESPAWHATCPAGTGVPLQGPSAPSGTSAAWLPPRRSISVPQRQSTERLWLRPALLQETAAGGTAGSQAGTHSWTESSS